jgi:hypothetical protein
MSEVPRGVGLGFGSILPLALSALMNRLLDHLDPTQIDFARKQNINEQLNDTY